MSTTFVNQEESSSEIWRGTQYFYDKETALDVLVRHAHDKLDAESCGLFLVDTRDSSQLVLEASYCDLYRHRPQRNVRLDIKDEEGGGLTGAIAKRGDVFKEHGDSLRRNTYIHGGVSDHLANGVCHSVLIVPFHAKTGQLLGVLKLENKKLAGLVSNTIGFRKEDEDAASKAALQIGQMLDRLSRFETFSVVRKTPQPEFVQVFLDSCRKFIAAEGGVIYRADVLNKVLRVLACSGTAIKTPEFKYSFDESSFATSIFHRGPDLASDPFSNPVSQTGRKRFNIEGPLGGVPLVSNGACIGVLVLWMPKGSDFKRETLNMLDSMCRSFGVYLLERERSRDVDMFQHSLIDDAPAGYFVKDADGRFLYCNKFFCEFVGKPLTDLLQKTDYDVFPRRFADQFVLDDIEVAKSDLRLNREERSCSANGEARFVRVAKSLLKSHLGGNIGVQGVFIDITDQKLAEASKVAQVGYWHWDIDLDIVSCSQELYTIFEIPVGKRLSFERDFLSKIHEVDRSQVEAEIKAIKQQPKAFRKRFRILLNDASTQVLEIKCEPVAEQQGVFREMLGTVQDVTDYVVSAAQAIQLAKNQTAGDLAHTIRHDMVNCFGGVAADIANMQEQFGNGEVLERVRQRVEVAMDLTKTLMELFGDRRSLDLKLLNVHSVAIEAINIEKDAFQKARIQVHQSFKSQEPCPEIFASKHHLLSIFLNLLKNAREATTTGGEIHVSIDVKYLDRGPLTIKEVRSEVVVEIRDTGIGISAEIEKRIFQKGFTTKTAASRDARGWGLYSCRRIAHLYGGNVSVENIEGSQKGAVARLILPASTILMYENKNDTNDR